MHKSKQLPIEDIKKNKAIGISSGAISAKMKILVQNLMK